METQRTDTRHDERDRRRVPLPQAHVPSRRRSSRRPPQLAHGRGLSCPPGTPPASALARVGSSRRPGHTANAIYLVRYGLPGAIALAGVIVIIAGAGSSTSGLGVVLIGVAGLVLLVDVFARLTISSQDDREREQQERDNPHRS